MLTLLHVAAPTQNAGKPRAIGSDIDVQPPVTASCRAQNLANFALIQRLNATIQKQEGLIQRLSHDRDTMANVAARCCGPVVATGAQHKDMGTVTPPPLWQGRRLGGDE